METYNIGDTVIFRDNKGIVCSASLSKIIDEYTIEIKYNEELMLLNKAEVITIIKNAMPNQINEYIKLHNKMIDKYTKSYVVKQDIECLKLKKNDRIAYDTATSIVKILYRKDNGGHFPKDEFECYNIPLDIKNLSFFEEYKEQKIKDGTFVLYRNNSYKKFKLYKVTKYDKTGSYKGTYTIKEVNGNDIVNNLTEANLTIPNKVYWFFNSEGSKCITYEGQNCKADEFRKMSNNYYDSKEAIDLAYAQMEGMAQK